MENKNNNSALGKLFAFIGILSALSVGTETNMETAPLLLSIAFLGILGYAVGEWAEKTIIRIIFFIGVIISFVINAAVRRIIMEIVYAIFSNN
jgi:uncharacterized membrane protein (Fun14 family)